MQVENDFTKAYAEFMRTNKVFRTEEQIKNQLDIITQKTIFPKFSRLIYEKLVEYLEEFKLSCSEELRIIAEDYIQNLKERPTS